MNTGNNTSVSTDTGSPAEASGRSIFWALATIVLYSASQPSLCGCVASGHTFSSTLWPHRTSPFVALIDGFLDLWIWWRRSIPQLEPPSSERVETRPTSAVLRIFGYAIGVLTQSAKLFGMSGIPWTQALAATFLFSSTTSLMRNLRANISLAALIPRIAPLSEEGQRLRGGLRPLLYLSISLQAIAVALAWSQIAPKIYLGRHGDSPVVSLLLFAAHVLALVPVLYLAQLFLVTLLRARSLLPRIPWMFPLLLINPSTITSLYYSPESRISGRGGTTGMQLLIQGCYIALELAIICFVVAFSLHWCAEKAYSRAEGDNDDGSSAASTESASTEVTNAAQDVADSSTIEGRIVRPEVAGAIDSSPEALNAHGLWPRTSARATSAEAPSVQTVQTQASSSGRVQEVEMMLASYVHSATVEERAAGFRIWRAIYAFGMTSFALDVLLFADIIGMSDSAMLSLQEFVTPIDTDWSQGDLEDGAIEPCDLNANENESTSATEPEGCTGDVADAHIDRTCEIPDRCDTGSGHSRGSKQNTSGQAEPSTTQHSVTQIPQPQQPTTVHAGYVKAGFYRNRNSPLKVLVRWLCILYFRLMVVLETFVGDSKKWTGTFLKQVMAKHGEIVWLAFGLLNFVTACFYYLLAFDEKGTSAPSWTGWLG